MNLEKILELLTSNSDIRLEYSYIDGKETLKINGKDINDSYDDSPVKDYIKEYYENVKLLDNCTFVEVMKEVGEEIDMKSLEELMEQESFTKEEAEVIYESVGFINNSIREKLIDKMDKIEALLEKF